MTIDPNDVEAQVRTQLHQALDAVPASGPPWSAVQPMLRRNTQRMRRRRTTIVGVAGLAALAVLLAVALPGHGSHTSTPSPRLPQRLQLVTQRFLGTTNSPPIAVGGGSVFVAVWDSGELLRLDPVTLKTTGRLQVGAARSGPLSLAYGAGSLWVLNFADSSLWRVNPTTMKRTLRVPLGVQPSQVFVGDGSIWVTECCTTDTTANRQKLVKLDPTTGATLGSVKLPGDGETVELAVGAVVAVNSENAPIQVLDPNTLNVRYTIGVGCVACPWAALAADNGGLYVAGADGVTRYSSGSARPVAIYADPAGITALTSDGSTLWASSGAGVVGLDRNTLAVLTTSPPLQGATAAFTLNGSVYVSVYGGLARLSPVH
jgi:outer membrane protein assembly factor BamB